MSLLSCSKTSVANVKNMPQYKAAEAYFHTNFAEQVVSFEDVPITVSSSFKAFLRYKVVAFSEFYGETWFLMKFPTNNFLRLHREDSSTSQTALRTPEGFISPYFTNESISNPNETVWTTVMIDWQKQTREWTVSWRFECTSACGACSSACVRSGSATAKNPESGTTDLLANFYSGPYTFRIGGEDETDRKANMHVSHVLISNSTETTWPTSEELYCNTTCEAGQYSVAYSLTVCTNCVAGKFSAAVGASTCANCAAGKYSTDAATVCGVGVCMTHQTRCTAG
jgi:hypothetical protein